MVAADADLFPSEFVEECLRRSRRMVEEEGGPIAVRKFILLEVDGRVSGALVLPQLEGGYGS